MEFITLKNREKKKIIEGVILHPLKINSDETGGILVETLRTDWEGIYGKGREFFMQYYSVTPPGLARDEKVWHYHPTYQEDRFLIVSGEIVVAVGDNREDSQTRNLLNLFHMSPTDDPYMLLIPKKTLHGFMVVSSESAVLLNFPTGLYNPQEEKRVSYNEVNVKTDDGELFSWDIVRKRFSGLSSS